MSSATSTASLPSGLGVLTTFPDVFFIPEIVTFACGPFTKATSVAFMSHAVLFVQIFGGLVWILVASSKVQLPILQGWVMFVSVFCFIMSTTLLCLYVSGVHGGSSSWVTLDMICHETAALFYLSAAVLEANFTYNVGLVSANPLVTVIYQENIAAVVFAFLATLMYVIHKVFSLLRWKSS